MEKEQITPNGIHVAVYVNDDMNEKVRKLAYLNAVSKSTVVKRAIEEYVNNHEKELNVPILNGK